MDTEARVKTVFEVLESIEMPRALRYRLKESARAAMQNGARFGGVTVTGPSMAHNRIKYRGVLHLWRESDSGGITPLTVEIIHTEGGNV
jgi:hypothetical protein